MLYINKTNRESLTVNGIESTLLVVRLQVTNVLADDQGKLDLIVQIDTLGTDTGAGAGQHER